MTLGQSLFAVLAISLLGYLSLSTNRNVVSNYEQMNESEFGETAVSLATSVIDEAMGKMFDAAIEDSMTGALTSTTQLTVPSKLGRGTTERYHDPISDFNDFDDFHNLFLVYKSDNPNDTASTPGSDYETIVPGLKAKYLVRSTVSYVDHMNLNGTSSVRTWHKKIVVSVINPTTRDTLVFPAVMSYWN